MPVSVGDGSAPPWADEPKFLTTTRKAALREIQEGDRGSMGECGVALAVVHRVLLA